MYVAESGMARYEFSNFMRGDTPRRASPSQRVLTALADSPFVKNQVLVAQCIIAVRQERSCNLDLQKV
jgi:hypothetical protein